MLKKNIFNFIIICFIFMFCTGCTTTQQVVDTNTRAAGKLEATVNGLDDLLRDSNQRLEIVREKSEGIADGIDRVIFLFGEYEFEVSKLLSEINRIRDETELQSEDSDISSNNSSLSNNN